jgi:ficolin
LSDNALSYHNNRPFTTKDKDNDAYSTNCAVKFIGAFWYGACHNVNLNGKYFPAGRTPYAEGLVWGSLTGDYTSLRKSTMMMRPV